ncbi:prolipoprotein diacylglyceryl transferase [candidate division WOR-3 bacterium RBG_13_43_14]|uniref:Phosphatidylglycerol--prolipoprotein diacylglyceryl transferase n=1 Tax=candidate division WOR-3 bacterium RBG_13_43_14 TaxID=1802590 RepID=A0A1F4UAR4_UNCW3|nr:MAG: prolipoprotein diacylglyceryl transferase [candidate division WOR-3 bacterium RBG_13_43_14]
MRPILFQIGGLGLPSYGLMLVISFLVAFFIVRRSAKRFDISPVIIENLAFYLMLGVIIGGRLLYVIFHWQQFGQDLFGIIRLWEGGMMFYGGFIGGAIASIIYLRKVKIPILLLGDLISPSIALGEFFTRIGCFLNGCCFGKPSDLPWAIQFPSSCVAGKSPVGQFHLHPTQLYTSVFSLLLFLFLQRQLMSKHRNGEAFAFYLILSGAFRFGIDFIRDYEDLGNLLINQFIAIGLVVAGIILYVIVTRRKIEPAQ